MVKLSVVQEYVYVPRIHVCSADLTSITPRYRNALFHSRIWGEYSEFAAAEAIHTVLIFVRPVPVTAVWKEAAWIG